MSGTYIQEGEVIDYTNPSAETAIAYLDVIDLGSRIGVAAEAIAASAVGSVLVSGVFELPAINTAAFAVGDEVYWDPSAEKVTNDGMGLTRAGWVVAVKAEAGTTARVKIS